MYCYENDYILIRSYKDKYISFEVLCPVRSQKKKCVTVMILSFRTYRSGQTVQTKIRLLLEEQSDQGLHCLLFNLHLFDYIP